MSAKIRKITVFFMFFEIEMTFILKLRGLHGNKIFDIKGNFISFKSEKKFFISLELFLMYWTLKRGGQEIFKIFNVIFFLNSFFLLLFFNCFLFLMLKFY